MINSGLRALRIGFAISLGSVFIWLSLALDTEPTTGKLALLCVTILGTLLIVYGILALMANIRVGKTIKGIKQEINKLVSNAIN